MLSSLTNPNLLLGGLILAAVAFCGDQSMSQALLQMAGLG